MSMASAAAYENVVEWCKFKIEQIENTRYMSGFDEGYIEAMRSVIRRFNGEE